MLTRTASGDVREDEAGDRRADGYRGDGGQDEPLDEGRLTLGDQGLDFRDLGLDALDFQFETMFDAVDLGFETMLRRLEIGLGRRPKAEEFDERVGLLGREADGLKFEDGAGARGVVLSGSHRKVEKAAPPSSIRGARARPGEREPARSRQTGLCDFDHGGDRTVKRCGGALARRPRSMRRRRAKLCWSEGFPC
jgi:hypothetical protein